MRLIGANFKTKKPPPGLLGLQTVLMAAASALTFSLWADRRRELAHDERHRRKGNKGERKERESAALEDRGYCNKYKSQMLGYVIILLLRISHRKLK